MIGLGSNKSWLGKTPREVIGSASDALRALGQDLVLSPLYFSPAWPDPKQPAYTNAVARMTSAWAPEALLEALLAVEAAYGRLRFDDPARRYAPRTLDLDLLAVDGERRDTDRLRLPHPAVGERDFVLLPLQNVSPAWTHPVSGKGLPELLGQLPEVSAQRL
ncbi:MAG: 2-amino-4-hydroxy-6-hydroxymethyldihydropteridine diphosphokinase [Parvularculaceae bacterium]|nr:2-amino-4-hydroxy-6-hydroxymethyldihydropteridine diphosphokinase [Parvularculaceae bacterium]